MPGLLSNERRQMVQDPVALQPGTTARPPGLHPSMKRAIQ
jgi:hypothetical protein